MRAARVPFLVCALSAVTVSAVSAVGPLIAPKNNVVVIVGDDVGVDVLRCFDPDASYGITDLPPMPNLDALAARGVRFTNAWANPACCPTRATVQTGRYGFRNGILHIVPMPPHESRFGIDLQVEKLIPRVLEEILGPSSVTSAAVGKWHLSTGPAYDDALTLAPNLAGYDYFSGTLFNIGTSESYFDWDRTENGTIFRDSRYATSANVDDALSWIDASTGDGTPWFLWLSFNAPHDPFHAPPAALHTQDLSGVDCGQTPRPCFLAMLEAMDTEIGRFLSGLDALPGGVAEKTTVLFVGDNGTPREVTVAPFQANRAKQTLYEGGVRVPLIVAGHGVQNSGRVSDALVNATDIFATVLELMVGPYYPSYLRTAMGDDRAIDAVSLMPILEDKTLDVREFAFAESKLMGANGKVIRELERDVDGNPVRSFKLLLSATMEGTPGHIGANDFDVSDRALYELLSDPFEHVNLLDGQLDEDTAAAYERMCGRVRDLCGVDLVCSTPVPQFNGRFLAGNLGSEAMGSGAGRYDPASWESRPSFQNPDVRIEASPSPSFGRTRVLLSGEWGQLRGPATLGLYDVAGRLLHEVWSGDVSEAPNELIWDGNGDRGRPLPSGSYLIRLSVGGRSIASTPLTFLR